MDRTSKASVRRRRFVKDSSSQADERRAMNERRHDLTSRIRKQKKSDLLTRKRREQQQIIMNCNESKAALISWQESLEKYIQNPHDKDPIQNLYRSIIQVAPASSSSAATSGINETASGSSMMIDNSNDIHQLLAEHNNNIINNNISVARRFIHTLAMTLQHEIEQQRQQTKEGTDHDQVLLCAIQILIHLVTAANAKSVPNETYYGHQSEGWVDLILLCKEPYIILLSMKILKRQQPENFLKEQICWLMGSFAQHSQKARNALRQVGIVPVLVSFITLKQQQQQQQPADAGIVAVSAAGCWVLANLLRDDISTLGSEFCGYGYGITPQFLQGLLTHSSSSDISTQAAWILAYLTNREDSTVNFLLRNPGDGNRITNSLFSTVLDKLYETTTTVIDVVTQLVPEQQLQTTIAALASYLDPLLRIIGNVSISCQGMYVPYLLADQRLIECIRRLSKGPSNSIAIANINNETSDRQHLMWWSLADTLHLHLVIWVTGCILCDAGIPGHPSTTDAAPTLIPLLFEILISPATKLQYKREVVSALWKAIGDPPPITNISNLEQHQQQEQKGSNGSVLELMQRCITGWRQEAGIDIIMALKDLLLCKDMDAIAGSIYILDKLLRGFPRNQIVFEHCNGVQALEYLCDNLLGSGSEHDKTAEEVTELAAELIDDFFSNGDGDDDDDYDQELAPSVNSDNNAFVFGAPSFPSNSFVLQSQGREGRGRGKAINTPAWMQK